MNFPTNKEIEEINLKFPNNIIIIKNNKPFQINKLSQKQIFIRNDFMGNKNIISNNSINKKLRNMVTSIEYSNKNNKKSYNNIGDKNIIMSEIDKNGKINIRVKEMKNSIEKILRENSFNKRRNDVNLSPQKLTYVKKNQGTHITKIKKHNTVNIIEYYPPPIPIPTPFQ